MLESVAKGVVLISLGMLLVASLYVLERCDFTEHFDPRHPTCVQSARNVRRGAVAAVSEIVAERTPSKDFPAQLKKIRTEAELLGENLSDLKDDSIKGARRWADNTRRDIIQWSKELSDSASP